MNQTQRQCKVTALDEAIEHLVWMNRNETYEYLREQRGVVIAELNHQAKRLSKKLPGMKEKSSK